MKRRKFLTLSTSASFYLLTGCGGGGGASEMLNSSTSAQSTSQQSITPQAGAKLALAVPALRIASYKNGIANYDLNIQEAKHQFFKGVDTDTFAMDATYLAPTLLMKRGDKISINYTNKLKEPTTMHGHGLHIPANMDGSPHQVINVGETWSSEFTVNQVASTNWYHPHYTGKTAQHVYKGLAGFIIIEDDEIKNLDLPNRYGIDDFPLALQDRFFDENLQIDYSPSRMQIIGGYVSSIPVTNGVIEPYLDVEAKEIRFRILNGSNSSIYNIAFDNNQTFKQIAADNSLLEAPVLLNSLFLTPGERAEIVIDLTNDFGNTIILRDISTNKIFLTINVNKEASSITTTPDSLTTLIKYKESEALRSRSFSLEMSSMGRFSINNRFMDINFINERVAINEIEIWEITNTMGIWHNFHIHGTHFMILERDGSSFNVSEGEKAYKDVVAMAPNSSVKLIIKMTDYVDSNVPYMYHCHFLEHEDYGMMGQFIVE